MVQRSDIDGQNRAEVFDALRSFDHRDQGLEGGLAQTLNLLELEADGLAPTRKAIRAGDLRAACEGLAEHYEVRVQPAIRAGDGRPGRDRADEIMDNAFSFYGETHRLGLDINWEQNPGTGHWGHDLNRFTYLSPLVGAYLETGDRAYGDRVVGLILDWIGKTDVCDAFVPGKSPYVWRSYLNIHIHLGNWCEALWFLLPDGFVSPPDMVTILKSVHDQLAYLEIVIPEQNSNWVVFGATGMLKTSLFFHELKGSEHWVRYSWDRFEEQLDNQVLPDGVQFELTQHYHYGVARSYVLANCLSSRAGKPVPEKSTQMVEKMVHYLHQTVLPDRRHLSFNDSDPNCGESVARFVTDSATLEACGVTSSRVTDGRTFDDLPSEAFPCAGVYVMRDRDLYLAFDGGPYGAHHQHEDKLSFWLAAFGRSLIADPGRYLYDDTTPFRSYLMSTRAHNTFLVDGQGQCSKPHRECYYSREPLGNLWEISENRVRAAAQYDLGYGEDGGIDVTHRRSVLFVPGRYWILYDVLEGEGTHQLESRFQFMPGDAVCADDCVRTRFADANVMVRPEAAVGFSIDVEEGWEDPRGGWYSDGYNLIEPAPQAAFRVRTALPFRAATLLLPYRGPEPPDVCFRAEGSGYRVVVDGEEFRHHLEEVAG